MALDPDDFDWELDSDDDGDSGTYRHSRAVRWTAILVVASFVLAGVSSLFRWF